MNALDVARAALMEVGAPLSRLRVTVRRDGPANQPWSVRIVRGGLALWCIHLVRWSDAFDVAGRLVGAR